MPTADGANNGVGYVDYVLWGDDGKPLAVLEAKKATVSIEVGRQQAKLCADCVEATYGRWPVIYLSNGYQHQMWDDRPPASRSVQGFRAKDELALLINRRSNVARCTNSTSTPTSPGLLPGQAIRKIAESFDEGHRKSLLVMATGAGKTRTTIALVDLLMRANLVKRVLFLADRMRNNQAVEAFKARLPNSDPVNLVTEKDTDGACTCRRTKR